jgi:GT2 family glycosyltransferase
VNEETVSVVIPMYNAASYVGRCLESVLRQDYPAERIEIVVVDGSSTDSSVSVVRKFMNEHPRIRLLPNPMRLTNHGLNIGIRDAKGDVIVFLGCRGVLEPTFVTKCIENLREVKEAAVVGGVVGMGYTSPLGKAIGLALASPFGVGSARYRYAKEPQFTDTVQFGAYRREVFDQVGLVDENMILADDDELNWRITKTGRKILMNPEIKFLYYPRHSVSALFRQYFGYGRGRATALKKHPDKLSLKHVVPSAFTLFVIVGFVVSLLVPYAWIPYASIWGLYLAAAVFCSTKIAAREGWNLFPILPVLFFVIHISYGLGFLRECIGGHRPPKPVTTEKTVK